MTRSEELLKAVYEAPDGVFERGFLGVAAKRENTRSTDERRRVRPWV